MLRTCAATASLAIACRDRRLLRGRSAGSDANRCRMSVTSKRQDHHNVIMSNVNLLKSVAVIAMLCTICPKAKGKGESAPADKRKSPPNIVLIISDDQHWRDYSFMGHEHIHTPNID